MKKKWYFLGFVVLVLLSVAIFFLVTKTYFLQTLFLGTKGGDGEFIKTSNGEVLFIEEDLQKGGDLAGAQDLVGERVVVISKIGSMVTVKSSRGVESFDLDPSIFMSVNFSVMSDTKESRVNGLVKSEVLELINLDQVVDQYGYGEGDYYQRIEENDIKGNYVGIVVSDFNMSISVEDFVELLEIGDILSIVRRDGKIANISLIGTYE